MYNVWTERWLTNTYVERVPCRTTDQHQHVRHWSLLWRYTDSSCWVKVYGDIRRCLVTWYMHQSIRYWRTLI